METNENSRRYILFFTGNFLIINCFLFTIFILLLVLCLLRSNMFWRVDRNGRYSCKYHLDRLFIWGNKYLKLYCHNIGEMNVMSSLHSRLNGWKKSVLINILRTRSFRAISSEKLFVTTLFHSEQVSIMLYNKKCNLYAMQVLLSIN